MNRFDKSWYCQYVFSLSNKFLRTIPTYRDRLFVSWSICSFTLVVGLTQLLFALNHVVLDEVSIQRSFLLYWSRVMLTISLLTTWLWGIWYFVRLIILYWLKDWLPLWMNGSLISCVLLAVIAFWQLWDATFVVAGSQWPMHQFHFLLMVSFGLGALLPTINNQRFPNYYFG